MPSGPHWKEFEHIIERLQRAFHPGADIQSDVRLPGRNSGVLRQIDIAVKQKVGAETLLIVVECKHWGRKVDVKAVEAFAGVKEDVGAHCGVMISARGFSNGAENLAERKQISLYRYRDTNKEAWPNGMKIAVIMAAFADVPVRGRSRRKANPFQG